MYGGNEILTSIVPAATPVPEPPTYARAALAGLAFFGQHFLVRSLPGRRVSCRSARVLVYAFAAGMALTLAVAGSSPAAKLVVMATNTTALPGAKVLYHRRAGYGRGHVAGWLKC